MKVKLEDVCERGSSSIKQSDIIELTGDYPIFGAAGYIGNVDFYQQEKPYVAVVKDGAGIGRTTLHPAKSSVIGTMQYLLPKENVLPEYLYYVVRYMHLEKYYTGATIPHIYFKDYKNEQFNLDSLDVQKKIVNILGKCEKIISDRQSELAELDDLIKARFAELFGSSPEGNITIQECCEKIAGGGTPSMQHPEYYGGNIPFIKSGDVKTDRITTGTLSLTPEALTSGRAKLVPEGTVVVVIRSAALLHEFHVAVTDNPVVINQDLKALYPADGIVPEFLMWSIKSQEKYLLSKVQTMLTSHIPMDILLDLKVHKATLDEQMKFVKFAEQVDKSKLLEARQAEFIGKTGKQISFCR